MKALSMEQLMNTAFAQFNVIRPGVVTVTCGCGRRCEMATREAIYFQRCPECQQASDIEQRRARTEAEWLTMCPAEYRNCDLDKLPRREKLEEMLHWKFNPRGLVLHGETGTGKTRCAWTLLRREHAYGKTVANLDSMAGLTYASKYSESARVVEKWFNRLVKCDLLLLDDIFKNKLTDSFENIIFTLVDQRIQHQRPILLTSNDTGETLTGRITPDRAAPLLRRLREHSTQIQF